MNPAIVLPYAFLGLMLNFSFAGSFLQPDWSLALLTAALLSDRHTSIWVLPGLFVHDLVLYWQPWVSFPFALLAFAILTYSDIRLAPGQPQRWLGLILICLPLLEMGISISSWLLTICLTIAIWSYLSSKREKVYVEPA